MATRKSEDVAKEKLIDSVKTSLNDAESLLREAASSTGDKANELRDRALTSLKRTREALYEAQDAVLDLVTFGFDAQGFGDVERAVGADGDVAAPRNDAFLRRRRARWEDRQRHEQQRQQPLERAHRVSPV